MNSDITDIVGKIPYRMAFAGGWIDQPFISKLNPEPPGSMVVVGVEPTFRFMERAGMATGTRTAALKIWRNGVPAGDRAELVKALYAAENVGRAEPSGSQDMVGLIYPGITRIDYDANHEGGIFPVHVETNADPDVIDWLERVIHLLPIEPRPDGYNPLGGLNLDRETIGELGQTGKDCFDSIVRKDLRGLAGSMNRCMRCWERLLPATVRHPTLRVDLPTVLRYYQDRYPGAMYSGCGGGYLYVVSEKPVPGAFQVRVRR